MASELFRHLAFCFTVRIDVFRIVEFTPDRVYARYRAIMAQNDSRWPRSSSEKGPPRSIMRLQPGALDHAPLQI